MKEITDYWVEEYLRQMRCVFYHMTDERVFTRLQRNKIRKTLKSFSINFDKLTKS